MLPEARREAEAGLISCRTEDNIWIWNVMPENGIGWIMRQN